MYKKLLLIITLLFIVQSWSQTTLDVELQGSIYSDSLSSNDVVIINKRTQKGTVSLPNGDFAIYAQVLDTLVFRSLQFDYAEIILSATHISNKSVSIRLKEKITVLDQLELSPLTLSGNLEKDTKKIPVQEHKYLKNIDFGKHIAFSDDHFYKGPAISTNPNTLAATPVNFLGIYTLIFGKPKKDVDKIQLNYDKNRAAEKLKRYNATPFSELMLERFPKSFFINDLKIEEEKLISYFAFSQLFENDLLNYLNEANRLKLIEYLTVKASEFLSNTEKDNVNLLDED